MSQLWSEVVVARQPSRTEAARAVLMLISCNVRPGRPTCRLLCTRLEKVAQLNPLGNVKHACAFMNFKQNVQKPREKP